jgi:hypothetical protein
MKNIAFLIYILVMAQSCQPQKEVIKETVLVKEGQQTGGVDDAGGGNGIDGKPLDEFIDRNFAKRPVYKNIVTPIIEKLKIGFPELAADFVHLTNRRDWYFVPGELEKIPNQILGAYAKLDQYALQDTRKVWIDNLSYEKMNERSQGILLLHELMMGVRLLKYKHKQDLCIADSTVLLFDIDGINKYKESFKKCVSTYPFLEGISKDESFQLDKDDYELIRRIVSFLILEEIDYDELRHLIKDYKVRIYPN